MKGSNPPRMKYIVPRRIGMMIISWLGTPVRLGTPPANMMRSNPGMPVWMLRPLALKTPIIRTKARAQDKI